MPYRVDIPAPPAAALDILVQLGALDLEPANNGIAALMPDGVTHDALANALGLSNIEISTAVARDDSSVWLLSPRTVRIGSILVTPPQTAPSPKALRLIDANAFGTGHHATTAMCVEILEEILAREQFDSILDVGTGSGILALAALLLGVTQAVGVDTDPQALMAAAENARLNQFSDRFELILGGPEAVNGTWPLVVANVLAAPLIEMASALVRRVGPRGRLILSGIPDSLQHEVAQTYRHVGIRHIESRSRSGWTTLLAEPSW